MQSRMTGPRYCAASRKSVSSLAKTKDKTLTPSTLRSSDRAVELVPLSFAHLAISQSILEVKGAQAFGMVLAFGKASW